MLDGVRLTLWIRKENLSPKDLLAEEVNGNDDEKYNALRENDERVFLTDPYYAYKFGSCLKDDIDKISVESSRTLWQQLPKIIIIPIVDGVHWRIVRIDIDYDAKKVHILFDDPYGQGKFPPDIKDVIIQSVTTEISKLINVQALALTEDDMTEKGIDQQGSGENIWDCGPIVFSNIRDYIRQYKENSEDTKYFINRFNEDGHDVLITKIRENDYQNYCKVIEVPIDEARINLFKQSAKESRKAKINELKKQIDGELLSSSIEMLEGYYLDMFFMVLYNKRQAELAYHEKEYTNEELKYAYDYVLSEKGTGQAELPNNNLPKNARDHEPEFLNYGVNPIDYFSGLKYDKIKTYEVTTKKRLFPENEKLDESIEQVLKSKEVKDFKQFHTEVYKLLWKDPKTEKIKYLFRYKYQVSNDQVNIGESDNLIFWLLSNHYNYIDLTRLIVNTYKFNIATVQDSNNNNLLHIAALYKEYDFIKMVFSKYKYKDKELLSSLINHRNQEGTTPLGMLFLDYDNKDNRDIIKIAKLFIAERLFEVNSYLNNNTGMDCLDGGFLKEIGGFNILHMAIIKDLPEILHALNKRNDDLGWKQNPDYICNFLYPSLNPESHMWSSDKLYQKYKQDNDILEEKLNLYIQKQIQKEDEDDSGDSSDEGSPAYYYKQQLLNLMKLIPNSQAKKTNYKKYQKGKKTDTYSTPKKPVDEKQPVDKEIKEQDIDNVLIPLFHGVPFIQGQYTNFQRREIAKKLVGINRDCLYFVQEEKQEEQENAEEVKVEVDPRTKALHSRTATANVGMETLYDLVESSQSRLQDLGNIDNTLINSNLLNQESFLQLVEIYTFNFSEPNSMQQFWDRVNGIDKNIIKYRFPCVSTSKAPDHAVKFAIGKNVETQSKGEKPLYPKYDANSYPKHRLAGLLYITLHKAQDLLELEDNNKAIDILKKYKTEKISLGQGDLYILYQLECNFWGYIGHDNIVAIIPIIYPNFNKEFEAGYHDKIWRLVENNKSLANNFDKAKELFKNGEFLPLYGGNGPITPAGKVLMPAFVELGLKLVSTIATSQGSTLGYFDPAGVLREYPIEYIKGDKYWSQAQINIKKPIDSRGNAKGKIKITPEQLRSNEDSSRKKSISTDNKGVMPNEMVVKLDFASENDVNSGLSNQSEEKLIISKTLPEEASTNGYKSLQSGEGSPLFDDDN